MERPDFRNSRSHQEVALRDQVGLHTMSDRERLALLSTQVAIIPPRQITPSTEEDPFELLRHEDTYEALAGTIFKQCEGLYNHLATFNPDVKKQFIQADKHPNKFLSITLPTASLSGLYAFNMTRVSTESIVQYTFARQDDTDQQKGFIVMRNPFGNFVLKRIEDPANRPMKDEDYYRALASAQRWVRDYAEQMNVRPDILLEYAEYPPHRRTAKDVALDGLRKIFTIESRQKNGTVIRYPRYSAILVAASLIPVGGYRLLGEEVGIGTWHAVNTFLESGAHHSQAQKKTAAAKAHAAIAAFDNYHFELPTDSAVLHPGDTANVSYGPTLNPAIEGAPSYPSEARLGSVRHLTDIDRVYSDGFDGLTARSCAPEITIGLGQTSLLIISNNPGASGDLSASLSNNKLEICNTSTKDLTSSDLDSLYIEPK